MLADNFFLRQLLPMKRLCAAALLPMLAANIAPSDQVNEADIRAHIAVLASDAFEGRAPGTEGANKTVGYIAHALQAVGAEPGAREGWYQPIALVERTPRASQSVFRHNGLRISVAPETVLLRSFEQVTEVSGAPVLYLGTGAAPDTIDPRGAVVLVLIDAPKSGRSVPGFRTRREILLKRGALAVIGIVGETSFDDYARGFGEMTTRLASQTPAGIEGAMSIEAAGQLFRAARLDVAAMVEAAADPAYRGVALDITADLTATNNVRRYDSHNVIGRITGSDPVAGAVLIMAHWDHTGICRAEGAADRICNGAIDNASGVALLIEAARRIAHGERSKRSIYFVATTAEERGLLGAHGFAEDPVVPLGEIQAVLNADTVAVAGKGAPLAVIGGSKRMAVVIAKAAAITGRRIDPDYEADAFLRRQDGWALSQKGVPAAMITGSFSDMKRLNAYLSRDYHGPGDALTDASDLSGAAEDATFHVVLTRLLSDPKEYSR